MPDEAAAMKAIRDDPEYQEAFKKAYGREMNYEDLGRAIGAFERTLIFVDSPFRRFLAGDDGGHLAAGPGRLGAVQRQGPLHDLPPDEPLEPAGHRQPLPQRRRVGPAPGLRGPGDARRSSCWREDASEQKLDELAVGTDLSELGRFMVTHNRADIGSFRTPLILNIGITGALHARRVDGDAVGRDRPLQQGRRGQSVPRRRHRAAGPDRGGDRPTGGLPLHADRRPLRRGEPAAVRAAAGRGRRSSAPSATRRWPCARRCRSSSG